ncbi:MAG: trehalose-phosphatase [Anaerolineaceae bacterium]|nr:trehalose-phosphatase [Anaerolineaceae bacterium]
MPPQPTPPFAPFLAAGRAWLFLDYDGTLAEFEPTPDVINPNTQVIRLLRRLVANPNFRVAITSGRRLGHTLALMPVAGLILAGTYGVELRTPEGEIEYSVAYDTLRPKLEQVKFEWERLITGRHGFYLEDKGFAVALHARFAAPDEASTVLASAQRIANGAVDHDQLKVLGGSRLVEVVPGNADKGKTVRYLWQRYPLSGAVPVYIGDDDKDEAGFQVVEDLGGMTILVARDERLSLAQYRLQSPEAVRSWVETLVNHLPAEEQTAKLCG